MRRAEADFTLHAAWSDPHGRQSGVWHRCHSYADGARSTLTVAKQDGYSVGTLTGVSFDAFSQVLMNYTNGQQVKGSRPLAFASSQRTRSRRKAIISSLASNDNAWITGFAQQPGFGSVKSGSLELSM